MSWEFAAQSSAIDAWLHKQIKSPSHGMIRAKLLMLPHHASAFLGEGSLLDLDDVQLDSTLGFQPRYPDVSIEGDPPLLAPAYALAALCYREGVSLANLSEWLESVDIVRQWLLLPPLAWRSVGLHPDAIPVEVLQQLNAKGQLQSQFYSAWHGHLPILSREAPGNAGSVEPVADEAALGVLQALGLTRQQCAKKLFLEIAPVRLLTPSEIMTLAKAGLDLSTLPIPLNDPEAVEVYWLWNKTYRSPDQADEMACTGLNALMVQAFREPSLSLSHFEVIGHPEKDTALLRVLDINPVRMRDASAKTKRNKLQDELGL